MDRRAMVGVLPERRCIEYPADVVPITPLLRQIEKIYLGAFLAQDLIHKAEAGQIQRAIHLDDGARDPGAGLKVNSRSVGQSAATTAVEECLCHVGQALGR